MFLYSHVNHTFQALGVYVYKVVLISYILINFLNYMLHLLHKLWYEPPSVKLLEISLLSKGSQLFLRVFQSDFPQDK